MNVFITGITGTLGTALTKLHLAKGDSVQGCSRNEEKVSKWNMEHSSNISSTPPCMVGDCADLVVSHSPVRAVLEGADLCYHLAAMKHVDLCEDNPLEAVHQNVETAQRVFHACYDAGVECVFVSSDKACLSNSVYGATKLIGENLAIQYGHSVIRLGNLIGSSGSVFQKWHQASLNCRPIQVTHPEMTRFFIPVEEAAKFIVEQHIPGQVVAPFMLSANLMDVARSITSTFKGTPLNDPERIRITGIRRGETLHQWLVSPDEAYEHKNFLKPGLPSLGTNSPMRIIQGHGEGISSREWARWDIGKLLEVAGIKV